MNNIVHDLIIIGSGPAGYTAAIYGARADLNPVLFAGGFEAGGALMNTTEVENYPGFRNGIMGPNLMAEMRAQAERFNTKIVDDEVISVDLTGPIKIVRDSDDIEYRAHSVILSTGSGYRKLGVSGEERLSGRGVSWCATCDGAFFKDRRVAVVGGGDSAVEEATYLTRFAKEVILIHRRDQLRASKIMVARAHRDPKITFVWNSTVSSINGETKLNSVTLTDTKTAAHRELPLDGLFIAIGHDPRSELFLDQVKLDDQGYVITEAKSTRTNLRGVFACGDLVDHTYRQAITAAGSGCAAALDAERYLASLQDNEV